MLWIVATIPLLNTLWLTYIGADSVYIVGNAVLSGIFYCGAFVIDEIKKELNK